MFIVSEAESRDSGGRLKNHNYLAPISDTIKSKIVVLRTKLACFVSLAATSGTFTDQVPHSDTATAGP